MLWWRCSCTHATQRRRPRRRHAKRKTTTTTRSRARVPATHHNSHHQPSRNEHCTRLCRVLYIICNHRNGRFHVELETVSKGSSQHHHQTHKHTNVSLSLSPIIPVEKIKPTTTVCCRRKSIIIKSYSEQRDDHEKELAFARR